MNGNDMVTAGLKFRIYPNKKQIEIIESTFGCCRWVWNTSLAYRDNEYKNNGVSVSSNDCINLVAKIKRIDEYKWLNEADSMALQQVLRDQQTAFSNFFRDNKKFRYPRFKSRKNNVNTYRTNCQNSSIRISCDEKRIKLPKIGWVKIKMSRNDFSSIHHATISRNSSGQYYVSLTCDAEEAFKVHARF